MTIGSDAIGRTPNDLEISNTLGVGTSPSPDSVAIFKAGFTEQLPNLATSGGLPGGFREINSVGHGLNIGSPVRIPSGAGGAFEDREVIQRNSDDQFLLESDITNPIVDAQILISPDIVRFLRPVSSVAFGDAGVSSDGALFFAKKSASQFTKFFSTFNTQAVGMESRFPASGVFDFDIIIGTGLGAANFRCFNRTNTTGQKLFSFNNGFGFPGQKHIQLGVDGGGTFFHPDAGNFGIGTTATPAAHQLEVVGETKIDGSISGGRKTSGAADMDSGGARVLAVTDTTAVRTVTLLTADLLDVNSSKLIQDESGGASGNNISLVTEGSALINGAASDSIITDFGNIRVYPNGTNWFIESRR